MCGGTEHEHRKLTPGLARDSIQIPVRGRELPPQGVALGVMYLAGMHGDVLSAGFNGDDGRTPSTVEHRGNGATARGFPAPGCGAVRKPRESVRATTPDTGRVTAACRPTKEKS